MQSTELGKTSSSEGNNSRKLENGNDLGDYPDVEHVVDVSGKNLDFCLNEKVDESVEGLYLYKNAYNLIPLAHGRFERLRILKYFANEVNLFPREFGNLLNLECLQVKISNMVLSGLPLHKLKALKELELSKSPPRATHFPILSDIAKLKCLTKLSICHFSIRYLPTEISCLNNLEYLDLSFNKLKSLPKELCCLKALTLLKVSNNKLVELSLGLSSLQNLEHLDLSNNRLTSLAYLELDSMPNLQNLNLQNNKLSGCQIPSWIWCNLEGNDQDTSCDEFVSSSGEMDIFESSPQHIGCFSHNGSPGTSTNQLTGTSNGRCFTLRKTNKELTKRYSLQQRSRQERLNNSRKCKSENHSEACKSVEKCELCKLAVHSESHLESISSCITSPDDDSNQILSEESESLNVLTCVEDDGIITDKDSINCTCDRENKSEDGGHDNCVSYVPDVFSDQDESDGLPSLVLKTFAKSKRHPDEDLDNPKPSKFCRSTDDHSNISCKYSNLSFCGIEDHLPDGFYDAGRDRPFMPLRSYEQNLHPDSREVILVDRERDEELDAIALSAQALVFHFKKLNGVAKGNRRSDSENLQIASLLALFVSDHFGGSDRNTLIQRTRKAVSGSNYRKPFVCTCPTGNSEDTSTRHTISYGDDIILPNLCEKSLQSIKSKRNSIIVPIGTVHFGVCRHRALLMKYLCDRMEPPVPCELVRGYLDFMPHAWNSILIMRDDVWVRMLVDACHPHDIREETDPEYFCRYVPLRRINTTFSIGSDASINSSFPSLSTYDEIEKSTSSTIMRCKFGSVTAVAKVQTLDVCETEVEAIKKFEHSFLGEIRIMRALKHSCIVEIYGHRISSKWAASLHGNGENRILQSVILMEYIKGGSLKSYINEVLKAGNKCLPVELVLCIARDVSCALVELHSKHIIHRDVKSENILIDLDSKKGDGIPVVKLCDFDRAVPLQSFLHTCCIAHVGIPPPDICVGTPRWMAPEVLRAMREPKVYGMQVDIWSFGCTLLEMLNLQIPYSGLPEPKIHDLLEMGERPPLTKELEILVSLEEGSTSKPYSALELETLRFLVDLYRRCTESDPSDRPTAESLYEMLNARSSLKS